MKRRFNKAFVGRKQPMKPKECRFMKLQKLIDLVEFDYGILSITEMEIPDSDCSRSHSSTDSLRVFRNDMKKILLK